MILGDDAIRAAVADGRICITPFDDALVQPASYEVTLAPDLVVWDSAGNTSARRVASHVLMPGRFILASTVQRVALPRDIAARVEGKSSWGRRGLLIHATAGWIDPGFEGDITLELKNIGPEPMTLRAGGRIGQLCFLQTTGASRPYGDAALGSRYQGQVGPTEARPEEALWK